MLDLTRGLDFRDRIVILSGSAHPAFAQKLAERLGVSMGQVDFHKFYIGEIKPTIISNVRFKDVYIVQPICSTGDASVHDNLFELALMIDAAQGASAASVTAVILVYGYGKQDKKFAGREPLSAKLVAKILTVAGANRVITIDLHSGSIQGFFDIKFDHLHGAKLLVSALKHRMGNHISRRTHSSVQADVGAGAKARWLGETLNLGLATVYKTRPRPDQAEVHEINGRFANKVGLILDDMIAQGGTIIEIGTYACSTLSKKKRMKALIPLVTHASPKTEALERILAVGGIPMLIVSNTVPIDPKIKIPPGKELIVVDVSALFALTIEANQTDDGSVSNIFKMEDKELGLDYDIMDSKGTTHVTADFSESNTMRFIHANLPSTSK